MGVRDSRDRPAEAKGVKPQLTAALRMTRKVGTHEAALSQMGAGQVTSAATL